MVYRALASIRSSGRRKHGARIVGIISQVKLVSMKTSFTRAKCWTVSLLALRLAITHLKLNEESPVDVRVVLPWP